MLEMYNIQKRSAKKSPADRITAAYTEYIA